MNIPTAHLGVKRARVEMLPLIDIVFLVLVVFIYAMLSMAVHRGLPVALPQSQGNIIENDSSLTITLLPDETILFNRQAITPEALHTVLQRKADLSPQPPLLLFADRDLSYRSLVRVLDMIHQAGIETVSLQTEPVR